MSRSSQHKQKIGTNGELSQDYSYDGTSARTRPFSFEDIMLRRKNRKEAGEIQAELREADNKEKIVEMPADAVESHKDKSCSFIPDIPRHVLADPLRASSRRKEDNASLVNESKLVKEKIKECRDDAETKSKLTIIKDANRDDARGGKSDRHAENRKRGDYLNKDSKNEYIERNTRDLSRKDVPVERGIRESMKDREHREGTNTDDRHVNKRRRADQARHDYENESKKRQSRGGLTGTEKYEDRHQGKSKKESKKRHQDEEKDRTGNRENVQKLELKTSKNSGFSTRKEKDSLRVPYEESRPRRKRSRSKERHNDRGRRSSSLSPTAHKHTSLSEQEPRVLSSLSSKDRSQRSHIDVERKRMSSNGSNSNYRRYSGSSGLGGYSPRKRKTQAAAKTPSPANRSPEIRSAGWDLPPVAKDVEGAGPRISNIQLPSQIVSLNALESSSVMSETPFTVKPVSVLSHTSYSQLRAVDSIQLTQATRPMRRLYVENLPVSASEKDLMECINSFLLSSGVNYVQGTLPCISCMIHREKGQALLEFLTPEDASMALSFNGRSFSGSVIKIRRPKDFVEVTTGVPDKSVDATNSISDIVEDSSHKIFIGGISKVLSSDMLLEIARAFGPVKAFHFEHNAVIDAPCAFLEYVDHLVTVKACAGLNGMKLGGQVLTVVQAIPDASLLGNTSFLPFYGIPEHVKPLLKEPTEILKLRNVFDPEGIQSLSEAELEEILEDIRLECTRFGSVKNVNVVKHSTYSYNMETSAEMDGRGSAIDNRGNTENVTSGSTAHEPENYDQLKPSNVTTEAVEGNGTSDDEPGIPDPLSSFTEPDAKKTTVSNDDSDDKPVAPTTKDENCGSAVDDKDVTAKAACQENVSCVSGEYSNLPNTSVNPLVIDDEISKASLVGDYEIESKVNVEEGSMSQDNERSVSAAELNTGEEKKLDIPDKSENKEVVANFGDIFEAGSVLVEFKRAEASCMAAHCLHGRLFDGRTVTVEYVSYNLYRRFAK